MKATAVFPSLNIKTHNNIFLKNLAENLGKGYRIIYCNNPQSQKMVVGTIPACNTTNMYLGGTDFFCMHTHTRIFRFINRLLYLAKLE
jgi:hypothetical protein